MQIIRQLNQICNLRAKDGEYIFKIRARFNFHSPKAYYRAEAVLLRIVDWLIL